MKDFEKIKVDIDDKVATIWLNQPEIHNALNPPLLKELTRCFEWLEKKKEIRAILMRGNGDSFCAGADIGWMKKSGEQNYRQNYSDSKKLAECFNAIYQSNKLVINIVHGYALGGAIGFLGVADFNYTLKSAKIGITELRLGLVPAVISPYLHTRVRPSDIRYQIFTGKTFAADEALKMGLIDFVGEDMADLEAKVSELLKNVYEVSQNAFVEEKKLLRELNKTLVNSKNIKYTIKTISKMKMSDDAKERMSKFMVKQK